MKKNLDNYNKDPNITNRTCQPSSSKMYEKEPPNITNRTCQPSSSKMYEKEP